MIKMKATQAELGAYYGIIESLHTVYKQKDYNAYVTKISAFLLNLYRIRGNPMPIGQGWRVRYVNTEYDIDTKQLVLTFVIYSDTERKVQLASNLDL